MRILIIEDDASIAELQRDYLEIAGFETVIEVNGADGLKRAQNEEFDLAIIDIMLPKMNGFDICKEIRAQKEMPLLIVSAKANDIDKIRALGLGADDYIVKPFSPSELVARVQAHISRYHRLKENFTGSVRQNQEIIVGNIHMQLTAHKVFVDNKEVAMTNKEFELLLLLLQNLDVVLSKEEILRKVWGINACIETATVAVHINRLRDKVERNPSNPRHIQTVWGIGYRFVP